MRKNLEHEKQQVLYLSFAQNKISEATCLVELEQLLTDIIS